VSVVDEMIVSHTNPAGLWYYAFYTHTTIIIFFDSFCKLLRNTNKRVAMRLDIEFNWGVSVVDEMIVSPYKSSRYVVLRILHSGNHHFLW
jgi:hypothetical protein